MNEKGETYHIRFRVTEGGLEGRFVKPRASGMGLSRLNPHYYEAIGRWICREIEAGAILADGTVELNP